MRSTTETRWISIYLNPINPPDLSVSTRLSSSFTEVAGGCKTYTKDYYRFVAQNLTSEGNIVVIPDYRLYPQADFTQIMDDVRHATVWVRRHIHEYGGDTNRLFLMGHSAGAHLAAMLTLDEVYLRPATYGFDSGIYRAGRSI